jgi:ABC-type transport system involved in multi-copper enzyme maturation permease subunit
MSHSTFATLLSHAWMRHRVVLAAIALAVGAFEFVLTRMAPAPNEVSWISAILTTLPPNIRTLLGNDVALSPSGFLALGYAHPFFMILLSAWVVRVSSAAIAGEIGRGTMDLLASRPVPRWHLAAAGLAMAVLGLAVILATAWLATAVGLRLRSIDARAAAFAPAILTAWLLFAAWSGVGLAISAARRDGGQAIAWTTSLLATSYALDYLARLWAPMSALRPLSLFRYYEPQAILAAGPPRTASLVLISTLIVTFSASVIVMRRRDL